MAHVLEFWGNKRFLGKRQQQSGLHLLQTQCFTFRLCWHSRHTENSKIGFKPD